MQAEIIAIGSEILLGAIVDTNSAAISRKLQTIGLPLHFACTVGDNLENIISAVRLGLSRSNVVITTGGLGPTVDDLTRQAMAKAVGKPLVFDEAMMRQIEERFHRFGRAMTGNNRRQAFRPEGSTVLENPVGTAPCFIVEQSERIAICLPGVPREMEYLMDHSVLPYLRQRLQLSAVIKSREIKVAGAGESLVDERVGDLEKLENPSVGLNAHSGTIVIRITARAGGIDEADRMIAPVETLIRERLGDRVFGTDSDTLEGVLLAELTRRGETLAVVESGTTGRLSGKLAEADRTVGTFAGGKIIAVPRSSDLIGRARQAVEETGAHWGLSCLLEKTEQAIEIGVGLWNRAHSAQSRRCFGGHPALAAEWASNWALDYFRTALAAAGKK